MLRSLFSAVSGMQAHQTKLDVIGNNIANVNTYGFKSSRARFQDVYYQTLQSATSGDNNRGGTNASQVGYGAQLAGIDLNMGRSALQSTGRPMDVAITGEGFFQVMDSDGNVFYTRAGNLQLDYKSGNLVDANGYTVLGVTGDPLGKAAGSDKIHLSVPSKNNAQSSSIQEINGIKYTITSQNATGDANVSITFKLDDTLPDGADVVVKSDEFNTSSITVRVSNRASFDSLSQFNEQMNNAITRTNNGKPHPAGNFTITAVPARNGAFTGEELLGENFGIKPGVQTFDPVYKDTGIFGGIKPSATSTEPMFTASGDVSYEAVFVPAKGSNPAAWQITATVSDGTTTRKFQGSINENSTSANSIWLKEVGTPPDGEAGQYIEVTHPGYTAINDYFDKHTDADDKEVKNAATITEAANSRDLGLGSKAFSLTSGSEGGTVSLADAGVTILANGIIEANHPNLGKIQIGRIDLVTFDNPYGLEGVGNSYFKQTGNSGEAKACKAGEDGTGALKTSSLEMSNVDISTEFADMIVTQRGFQANSRIITVSDSILEELVNLKR